MAKDKNVGKVRTIAPHPTTALRESSQLDLVHSDVRGLMPHQSLGGASYFVTFIDDSTRKVWA